MNKLLCKLMRKFLLFAAHYSYIHKDMHAYKHYMAALRAGNQRERPEPQCTLDNTDWYQWEYRFYGDDIENGKGRPPIW